jgi:catechol 2,3-dioxygenase-like lactoylglutathione lyase family enzyme
MRAGGHDAARAFYGDLLGLEERDVPPKLDPSQLVWFRVGGDLELHLYTSDDTPTMSQHFCLRVDAGLDQLRTKLEAAGVTVRDTSEIVGRPRFMCCDPFGNWVELTEWR